MEFGIKRGFAEPLAPTSSPNKQNIMIPKEQILEEYLETNFKSIRDLDEVEFPFQFKRNQPRKVLKKEYDNLILKPSQLPHIKANLSGILAKFLQGLQGSGDFPQMENNFFLKTQNALNILQKNGFKLSLTENKEGNNQDSLEIIETNHYLGLFVQRSLNFTVNQYLINRALEAQGIVIYMPKYIKPGPDNKLDHSFFRKQGKQMILRVHVQHKSPFGFQIEKPNREKIIADQEVWHHAIFENQLKLPPPMAQIHLEYIEWFKTFRLADWTLVDYDEIMKGNRLLNIDKN